MNVKKWMPIALLTLALNAQAAVPSEINYQGLLTDSADTALPAVPISVEFRFYDGPAGPLLHGESHTVIPQGGRFEVRLGTGAVLPGGSEASLAAAILAHDDIWMGITAGADPEMTPRLSLASVAFALRAGDADTQGGQDVAALVTALQAQVTALQSQVTALSSDLAAANATLVSLGGDVSTLNGQVSALQANDSAQDAAIATLEARADGHDSQLSNLSNRYDQLDLDLAVVEGKTAAMSATATDVTFTGVNLHIVDGSGDTGGAVNGRGNLIIGYNENTLGYSRSGSHNLVVGEEHGYTSYGGLLGGYGNRTFASNATAAGGIFGYADGAQAAILGGYANRASGQYATVSGGGQGEAAGYGSSVSGGSQNNASATYSSVSGGGGLAPSDGNTAAAAYSSITGGKSNTTGAGGDDAYVCGGVSNTTSAANAVVCPGADAPLASTVSGHTTSIGTLNASVSAVQTDVSALETKTASMSTGNDGGGYSSVFFTGVNLYVRNGLGGTDGDADGTHDETPGTVNGLGNLIVGYNESVADQRTGSHNLIIGARHSYSSYGGLVAGFSNNVANIYASVSGGYNNTASGVVASVQGGTTNSASSIYASVSGGSNNTASASSASVLGGYSNLASGTASSISSGYNNEAGGSYSSVSGGSGNTATASYASITGGSSNSVPSGDNSAYICGGSGYSTVNANDVICSQNAWHCPTGMSWAGGHCIENAVRTATTWDLAMIQCYNIGGTICPMEALLSCDQMPGAYIFSDCGTALDTPGTNYWTSETTATGGSSWTTNIAVVSSSNTVTGVSAAGSNPYWCCLDAYR